MRKYPLASGRDVQSMRDSISLLGDLSTVVDFEELIQMDSIRANTRLWRDKDSLAAFAYVDDSNNLWYDLDPAFKTEPLEKAIVEWGAECVQKQNLATGETNSLDACVRSGDLDRISALEHNGFIRLSARSLGYTRLLSEPVKDFPLPPGFSIRCVKGEEEANALVILHQSAFGTENMTIERRLAIMRSPEYLADLDLVVLDPAGKMVAFCVCGLERGDQKGVCYTEPIGTDPHYQGHGLGKAVLAFALRSLQIKGGSVVTLGTSSENHAMQRLAESLGFTVVSEKIWFSKEVV